MAQRSHGTRRSRACYTAALVACSLWSSACACGRVCTPPNCDDCCVFVGGRACATAAGARARWHWAVYAGFTVGWSVSTQARMTTPFPHSLVCTKEGGWPNGRPLAPPAAEGGLFVCALRTSIAERGICRSQRRLSLRRSQRSCDRSEPSPCEQIAHNHSASCGGSSLWPRREGE